MTDKILSQDDINFAIAETDKEIEWRTKMLNKETDNSKKQDYWRGRVLAAQRVKGVIVGLHKQVKKMIEDIESDSL